MTAAMAAQLKAAGKSVPSMSEFRSGIEDMLNDALNPKVVEKKMDEVIARIDSVAEEMFRQADKNKDGKLDLTEFRERTFNSKDALAKFKQQQMNDPSGGITNIGASMSACSVQ